MKFFSRTTHADRAAHGARMLDLAVPGWHWDIDSRTLDISRVDECVLGQLYDDYGVGLSRLGIEGTGDLYGFYADLPWSQWRLTRAWKKEVNARCAADAETFDDEFSDAELYGILDEAQHFQEAR